MNRKEETKAFREWLEAWLMPSEFSPGYLYKLDDDGEYAIDFVRTAWEAWEARAVLRASAASEEGMDHRTTAEPDLGSGHRSAEDAATADAILTDIVENWNCLKRDEGAFPAGDRRAAYSEQRLWHSIQSAKAWLNRPGRVKLDISFDELKRLRAALAPATEGGGREARAEDIAIEMCLTEGRDPDAPTSVGEMCDADNQPVPTWMVFVEQAEALLEKFSIKRRALSPSPSVGTPEMTSADRGDAA